MITPDESAKLVAALDQAEEDINQYIAMLPEIIEEVFQVFGSDNGNVPPIQVLVSHAVKDSNSAHTQAARNWIIATHMLGVSSIKVLFGRAQLLVDGVLDPAAKYKPGEIKDLLEKLHKQAAEANRSHDA